MAAASGFPLSPRFVIHPRPFDRCRHRPGILRAGAVGEEREEPGIAAEYLAFSLERPFKAPRKQVALASPRTS